MTQEQADEVRYYGGGPAGLAVAAGADGAARAGRAVVFAMRPEGGDQP